MKKLSLSIFLAICVAINVAAQDFPIIFDFTSEYDTSGNVSGTLENGATLETLGEEGVLNLGSNNGYFNLSSAIGTKLQEAGDHFTISVNLNVPTTTDISANGNFIWSFAKSSSDGYLFINAKELRYAITQSTWWSETSVNSSTTLPRGKWVNVMYVQNGSTGTVYLDNVQKAQKTDVSLYPNNLSDLENCWLGRSPYSGDAYLKNTRYADFRIYDTVLNEDARARLCAKTDNLNRAESGINSDEDAVNADKASIGSSIPFVAYRKINLPTEGTYGTQVTWHSGNQQYLSDDGTVMKQENDRDVSVQLTATFTLGEVTKTETYTVKVKQKEEYSHYLFAFFPSNSNENIYFAIGEDGYNYTTINNDQPVFTAAGNTVMGGLRDPHILRGEDGYFYMVATDMRSALGWASNRGMVLMKSPDLINWTSSTVHFPTKYAGTWLANVTRVWAPETIYDKEAGKYMIYFSILTNDGTVTYDKVFYAYANADFTDLEGEPVYFYDRGSATIDMDIVFNEADGLYHAFYKNEGSGGICKVTATSLTPTGGGANGSQWSNPSGTLQQTNEAVEGAGVFRLINDDNWILMYDCYSNGHYQFCSSPDLSNFTWVKNTATSGSFTPRHGTVLPITEEEYEALIAAFPSPGLTEETDPDEDGNLNLTADRIPQLCESTDGWTSVSGFGILASSANYTNGEACVNGSFMERWRQNRRIGENSATKTLRYLPEGSYKLRGSCIASWQPDANVTVNGVTFYADDKSADVHTADGVPERYTFIFDIDANDDYTTSFGIQTSSSTNANWVAFDNMRLYFIGTETEYRAAMRQMHDDYIARATTLYEDLCDDYLPALQAAVDAVDPDAIDYTTVETQLDRLVDAIAAAQEHIASTVRLKDSDTAAPATRNGVHVQLCRSLASDMWQTLCLPFSMTSGQITQTFGNGTVVKELLSAEGGEILTLTFKAVDAISANVPVIIRPAIEKQSYCISTADIRPSDNPSTILPAVSFCGNYTSGRILSENDYYILNNTFYHSPGSVHLKAYRAWFSIPADSPTKSLSASIEGILTGIEDMQITTDGKLDIYDLTGRKIQNNQMHRGVYIINGNKVILK